MQEFDLPFTKNFFQKALNIEDPWYIKDIDFNPELKQLDIWIDFKKDLTFLALNVAVQTVPSMIRLKKYGVTLTSLNIRPICIAEFQELNAMTVEFIKLKFLGLVNKVGLLSLWTQ